MKGNPGNGINFSVRKKLNMRREEDKVIAGATNASLTHPI